MFDAALSPIHLLVIIVALLLLFGPKKLPNLARSIGEATQEFRKGIAHADTPSTDADKADKATETKPGT